MKVLSLIFLLILTYIVIRFLCLSSRLSLKVLLIYFIVGMLLGPIVIVPLHRILDPYNLINSLLFFEVGSLITISVLLAPLFLYLSNSGLYLLLTTSDIFLLAFIIGLGYDSLGVLVSLGNNYTIGQNISFWIPWQDISLNPYLSVGTSYRLGFVATLFVLGNRFIRRNWLTPILVVLGIILVAGEMNIRQMDPDSKMKVFLSTILNNGSYVVWIILLFYLLLSWWEIGWIDNPRKPTAKLKSLIAQFMDFKYMQEFWIKRVSGFIFDLQSFLRKIFLDFKGDRPYRLMKQYKLIRAERSLRPKDLLIQRIYANLKEQVQQSVEKEKVDKSSTFLKLPSQSLVFFQILLILVVLLMMVLGIEIKEIIHWFLMIVIIWIYVSCTHDEVQPDANNILKYYGGQILIPIGLLAVFIVFSKAFTDQFYPRIGYSIAMPSYNHKDVDYTTAILLLAMLGFTLFKSTWRLPKIRYIRKIRLFRVLGLFILIHFTLKFYKQGITYLHTNYGDILFYIGSASKDTPPPEGLPLWLNIQFVQPAPFGNNVAAWILGLLIGIISYIVIRVFNSLTERLSSQ